MRPPDASVSCTIPCGFSLISLAGNRISSKMADAHNFSTGAGGGNDWELVSLTASTYAAAPGPILPLLGDDKADSPPPAVFMSQHFNLPAEAHTHLPGCQEFSPAGVMGNDDDTHLNIPCAKNCERELDDGLITRSDFWDERKKSVSTLDHVLFTDGSGLGGLISLAAEDQTTMFRSPDAASDTRGSAHHVSADAATDGIVDSAHLSCLTAHVLSDSVAISSGVTCIAAKNKPKIPCEAWWKKTISFLCNNAKESVTFRFIFVAATVVGLAILGQHEKLQLQQLRLQFNVDSEKISCSAGEPLGQVKIGMIVGGSPVAQG